MERPNPASNSSCSAVGLYLHIPFCARKCHYCDFNSGPAGSALREQYIEALLNEIRSSPWGGYQALTLFLGGGTPSELSTSQLEDLLTALRTSFQFRDDAECTIECNPGSVDRESFERMRQLGLNRISLGVQSFNDQRLQELGRIHSSAEAHQAYLDARAAGFENISLDLIFSLPDQILAEWEADLEKALEMEPDHLSLYHLTLEPGTDFWNWRNRLCLPDEETGAAMYERAIELCEQSGFEQYEISNFARPGFRSRHNQLYWSNRPYLGFGVSAASYYAGVRWSNTANWSRYIEGSRTDSIPLSSCEALPGAQAIAEEIMLRLRTTEGFSLPSLSERYRQDVWSLFEEPIQLLTRHGLLTRENDSIRLTRKGLLLANEVCGEFLRAAPSRS